VKYHEIYRDPRTDTLVTDELIEFWKSVKDKGPLSGIVESVKSGSSLNILLPQTMDMFPLMLAGVRSPGFKGEEPEQFAHEAKFITEHLLLHRDVKVTLESMDKYNLYGTVLTEDGQNIALTLLSMGLASFVEWSTSKKGVMPLEKLREAEKYAQEKRRRLWEKYQPPIVHDTEKQNKRGGKDQGKPTKETSITGRVMEIVNAGTITVRVAKADANNPNKTVDRIINFSSIRPPRPPIVLKQVEEEQKNKKDWWI